MNLLEELKKRPLLYEDSKGIVAISNYKVIRVTCNLDYIKYEKYKKLNSGETKDKNDIKRIIGQIMSIADFECRDIYPHLTDEKEKPEPIINYIRIEEYMDKLTPEEKESLYNQLVRFRQLYKEYMHN